MNFSRRGLFAVTPAIMMAADYRPMLAGHIAGKQPWTVEKLYTLPQVTQITRHVCVEGWSMIGKWTGTPLSVFLNRIDAGTTAQYAGFDCAGGYYEGIGMPTALHPQTLMAFKLSDNTLPTRHGYPSSCEFRPNQGLRTRSS